MEFIANECDRKVLLIGWDSIDWSAIDPLIAQGAMPAVNRMASEGVLGKLSPVRPLISPMLWTSLATGVRADKHRILGFYDPEPAGGLLRQVSSENRCSKAIWNWTTEAGLPTHVVGWPATSSVESLLGVMLSDACFDEPSLKRAWANGSDASFERALQAVSGWTPSPLYARCRSGLVNAVAKDEHAAELLEAMLSRLDALHAVSCVIVQHLTWSLSAICYPTVASWIPTLAIQGKANRSALPSESWDLRAAAWRLQDAMLEDLSQQAGPESTVVLVSPQATPRSSEANSDERDASCPSHECLGLIGLAGPGVTNETPLVGASVLDLAPTIGRLLGISTGTDIDGRALSAVTVEPSRNRRAPSACTGLKVTESKLPHSNTQDETRKNPAVLFIAGDDATCRQVRLNHRVNLALALSDSNRISQAVDAWTELQEDYPEDPFYAIKLVDCLVRCEQYDACHDVIEGLPGPVGEHGEIRLAVARIAHARGDTGEAVRIAHRLSSRKDATAKLLLSVARLLVACDAEPEAVVAFQRCLGVGGDNPITLCGLASALWTAERYEESLEAAQAALAIAPAYTEARYHLALALRWCGRDAEAIAPFERCLEEGWAPKDTHGQLASLYWGKDTERASHHRMMAEVN